MATYNEAHDARNAAAEIVSRYGGTILQVNPKKENDDWVVEVEIASPLPSEVGYLSYAGVRIVVHDHGVRPLAENLRMQNQRPRGNQP